LGRDESTIFILFSVGREAEPDGDGAFLYAETFGFSPPIEYAFSWTIQAAFLDF